MRNTFRIVCIFLTAACLTFLGVGCASYETPDTFGQAVTQARADQTLNPGPPSLEPVTGLDGEYAAQSMKNYQEAPRPAREVQSVNLNSLFNVGGGQ